MSSKQFTAKTFAWLRQINRGRYLAMDLKVALELIEYFNERDQNGRAYPSYKIIGERIGVSEHTVIRSIQRLHDGGDLYVIWGKPGRGNPNQYWMIIKPAPAQVSAAGKPARRSARKPASEAKKTCTATQENHLKNHLADGECLRTPHPPGERVRAYARMMIP